MGGALSFQLQSIDRTRLYRSIVDQILDGIETGAYPPGVALPAERVLAAGLGVSRGPVREAIRVLEHAGVLEVRTGSGTYVTAAGASRAAALRAHAALAGEQSPLDVIAARRALEPAGAELAAAQRHPGDLAAMQESLTAQAGATTPEEVAEADLAFHLALAGATRNPVFAQLMEHLAGMMRTGLWAEFKYRERERGASERDLREHGAVLDAVEHRHPGRAAEAMSSHLDSVERELLEHLGSNDRDRI